MKHTTNLMVDIVRLCKPELRIELASAISAVMKHKDDYTRIAQQTLNNLSAAISQVAGISTSTQVFKEATGPNVDEPIPLEAAPLLPAGKGNWTVVNPGDLYSLDARPGDFAFVMATKSYWTFDGKYWRVFGFITDQSSEPAPEQASELTRRQVHDILQGKTNYGWVNKNLNERVGKMMLEQRATAILTNVWCLLTVWHDFRRKFCAETYTELLNSTYDEFLNSHWIDQTIQLSFAMAQYNRKTIMRQWKIKAAELDQHLAEHGITKAVVDLATDVINCFQLKV